MEQLRIALTISGAVALGAYEGGALAALLTGVQALLPGGGEGGGPGPIRIDAIGGASAGSITGLLTARTLLEGLDPLHVMAQAWVVRDSIDAMRTRDPHSPLSVDALRQTTVDLLDPAPGQERRPRQQSPIKIHMALAALRGLGYKIGRLKGHPIDASTYLDWGVFTLGPRQPAKDYLEPPGAAPLDFALASGANALGFPPRALNRTVRPEDREALARHEITNFPESGWLWYTDGGTIENEPLGRTLDLANEIDSAEEGGTRLHLLVHPHPTAPPSDDSWSLPDHQPEWTATLSRSEKIQRTQSLYDDLRHLEKTNSRLHWIGRVNEVVGDILGKDGSGETAATLRDLLAEMEGQKERIDALQADAIEGPPAQPSDEIDVGKLLQAVLQQATGVAGKKDVAVDVVSPLILPEAQDKPVEKILAGEFLGHFGGFLDERLRKSDFVLGFRSMLMWMERLPEYGVTQEAAALALEATRKAQPDWDDAGLGEESLRSLPRGARMDFYRLALHIVWLSAKELLHKDSP